MKKVGLMSLMMMLMASSVWSGECKKIVVTGNPQYPPILFRDKTNPGKLVGISIELLEKAFGELGIEVEAVDSGSWARAQKDAQTGQVDMLAGAFITEERKTYMDYILPPFMTIPSVIWVMKGQAFPFEKWEDLIGLTGGTLINNSFGEKFDAFAKEKLTIEQIPRIELAFRKLEAGRNRYVLYESYQGLAILESLGFKDKFEYLPLPVSEEGLYFTFSQKSACNDPKLKDHLVQKVNEYTEQKMVDQLMEKYLAIWKERGAE